MSECFLDDLEAALQLRRETVVKLGSVKYQYSAEDSEGRFKAGVLQGDWPNFQVFSFFSRQGIFKLNFFFSKVVHLTKKLILILALSGKIIFLRPHCCTPPPQLEEPWLELDCGGASLSTG